MLGEVVDEEVPAVSGDARAADVVGHELPGEFLEEGAGGRLALEDFAVAVGVGVASVNDVRAVRPSLAGGVQERAVARERVADRLAEFRGRRGIETVCGVVEYEDDAVAVGDCGVVLGRSRGFSRAGEFLDQPRPRGFLYPPRRRETGSSPYRLRHDPDA